MLLAALLTLAQAASAAPAEMRGLWVVRTGLVSPEAVDRAVDDAARAGFNAVFAQVRGRCDAFYPSSLSPRSALLANQPATFDPLGRLLRRARARGLQVHAWVNVLLCAPLAQPLPAGHVLRRHPAFAMVARSEERDVEGVYLSPSAPGVAEHLEDVVRELIGRYPVDGLHLDYIRYPGPDYDYSAAALDGFARDRLGAAEPATAPALSPHAWATYRRKTLSALARRLAQAARQERPGITVSAAVVPDEAQAVHHKYQDWPAWIESGIVDAVSPMAYSADVRVFRRQLEAVLARTRGTGAVWAGIGAYRLSLAGMAGHVREARGAGATGVLLFSHEWLLPSDAATLRAAFGLPPPAERRGLGAAAGGTPRR